MKNRFAGFAAVALAASAALAAEWKSVEDVMDYGAVGDGRTDDTAAILKAEAAAWASGKPLFFPKNDVGSTYLTRKGVILVSGMTLTADKGAVLANASAVLEGGGRTLRIRLFRPAKKGDTVLYLTNVDGLVPGQEVTIYNDSSASWGYSETLADIASVDPAANAVTIDTSRYADDGKNLGMRSDMPAGTGSVLTDFALVKTVQRRGRDAVNVIVENITVRPYGNPNDPYIYTISPIAETAQNRPAKQTNFIVRGVTVDGSMHDGISTQGSGDIWIENCVVRNVKHKGIHWGTSCDRVIIRGNLCEDCGSPEFEKVSNNGGTGGMYFCYNNHRMIIEDNVMRRCFKGVFGYDGREVGGSDTDSIVANNLFDDCTQCGLQLMGGFHLTATGNRFVNFTGDAVPILSVKEWKGLQYPIISDNVAENFQDGYNAAHEPIDLTYVVGAVARNNKAVKNPKAKAFETKEPAKEKKPADKRSFVKQEAFAADFDISRDWYAEFVQRLDVTEDVNSIAQFAGISFRYLRGGIQALWSAGGATRYVYGQRLPNVDLRWPASESHHFLVMSTNRVVRAYLDGRLVFVKDYAANYEKHPYARPANNPRQASVHLRHDVRLFRVGYLAAGTVPEKLVAERFNGGRPLAWTGEEPDRILEFREAEINPEGVVTPERDPYAEKVSGEGAPRRAPRFKGQRYRDAKTGRKYVAAGNALPCDWKPDFKDEAPKAKDPHARPEFVNPYEVVTVYGAVGDGTNDDSQAIAKAVAAAAKSGKPVYFPKTGNGSVYAVSAPVEFGKGIRVVAHPGAFIRSTTTALRVAGDGVSVENLGFTSLSNDAVVVEKAEKVRFLHIQITGAGANGLVLKDCEEVTVEDSLIRDAARAGVRIEGGCEKTTLLGNLIAGCGFSGAGKKRVTALDGGCVEFAGAEETVLKCNHFTDSANGVYGGGKDDEKAEVVYNTFNNLALAGVALGGGEKMRFYGNRFLRFGGTAIPFKAFASGKDKPFRESVIEANGFASFEAAMSPNGKRKNESAYVNAEGAIVLDGVKDVKVVGNSLRKDTLLAKEAVAAEASVEIKVVNSSGVKTEDNVVK